MMILSTNIYILPSYMLHWVHIQLSMFGHTFLDHFCANFDEIFCYLPLWPFKKISGLNGKCGKKWQILVLFASAPFCYLPLWPLKHFWLKWTMWQILVLFASAPFCYGHFAHFSKSGFEIDGVAKKLRVLYLNRFGMKGSLWYFRR